MAPISMPAWVFLLGALVVAGAGVLVWTTTGNAFAGVSLLVAALVLGVFGVMQGQRALATEAVTAAPAAVPAVSEKSVEDYSDPAAVRGIPKGPRVCAECGSPVLAKAKECPTCGSALS